MKKYKNGRYVLKVFNKRTPNGTQIPTYVYFYTETEAM